MFQKSVRQNSIACVFCHLLLFALLLVIFNDPLQAESPPNLTTDITWSAGLTTVNDIETAFNFARRQEEIQLGLTAGKIGNLDLPSQAVYDTWTDDEKALFIMNDERVDRAGMLPGVIGLPFQAVQTDVDNLAQYYATYTVNNNGFGHEADGFTPFQRIDNDPALGPCHEFLSRAENIAYFWTSGSTNPLYIEQAIYLWLYDDSSSAWGHRETVLLQDKDVATANPANGFNNNVGSAASEGLIGIGVAESPTYDPFGWGWVNLGTVVVMEMIDPISTGSCPWDGTPTPTPSPTNTPVGTPTPFAGFHLCAGLNLISVPVSNAAFDTAGELVDEVCSGDADAIWKYDCNTGAFTSWTFLDPGSGYSTPFGMPFWVNITNLAGCSWNPAGSLGALSYNLCVGMNIVSKPIYSQNLKTADDMMIDITGCQGVWRWKKSANCTNPSGFNGYFNISPPWENFPVLFGHSYWVTVTGATTWNPPNP